MHLVRAGSRLDRPAATLALLGSLAAGLGAAPGSASAQPAAFSTGVDAAGALLPPGALDPHWTFVKGAPTNTSGNAVVIGSGFFTGGGVPPYAPNTATARWISTVEHANTGLGDVVYTQQFDLSGYHLATVGLSASFAIADNFRGVFLNGTRLAVDGIGTADIPSFMAPWALPLHTFSVAPGSALLLAGPNVLEFRAGVEDAVYNGLFVDLVASGQRVAAVPEPGTVTLLLTGLVAVGAAARRRRA